MWLGSTSAFTAANGLSTTIATSISPPSFLMIADRPACVLFKIAKALFSQMHLSHSSVAVSASDPVCGGALLTSKFPARGGIHCQATERLVCWLQRLLHDACHRA